MDRNVNIIKDTEDNRIVLINDIIFKGKRSINWADVENYLKQYVGEFYLIADTDEIVYIGADLPDEYANSNYSVRLKGTAAKAKANAAQGLPEMIEVAAEKQFEKNKKRAPFSSHKTLLSQKPISLCCYDTFRLKNCQQENSAVTEQEQFNIIT